MKGSRGSRERGEWDGNMDEKEGTTGGGGVTHRGLRRRRRSWRRRGRRRRGLGFEGGERGPVVLKLTRISVVRTPTRISRGRARARRRARRDAHGSKELVDWNDQIRPPRGGGSLDADPFIPPPFLYTSFDADPFLGPVQRAFIGSVRRALIGSTQDRLSSARRNESPRDRPSSSSIEGIHDPSRGGTREPLTFQVTNWKPDMLSNGATSVPVNSGT